MPALETPVTQSPDQTDQDPRRFSINPSLVGSQDILEREKALNEQALQTQTQSSLQRQATPAEQQAPAATDLTDQTVSAANKVVGSYNNFILQGGDLTKLSKDDLDAVVSGAASLPPIEHPETDPARMLAMYRKGTLKPTTLGWDLGAGAALQGAGGLISNLITEGGQEALHLVPGTGPGDADNWLKFWLKRGSADIMARCSIPDQYASMVTGGVDIINATRLAMEQAGTTDPDKSAQIDARQTEIIRQRMLRETGAQKAMTDARDATANVFKSLGANQMADTITSVKPDDPSVQFSQTAGDPLNILMAGGEAVASKILGGTAKAGVRFGRLADATEAINGSLDRQAAAALGRTQIESALSSTAITDAARAGMESDLARIKNVQTNLAASHDVVTGEYQAALGEANDQLTRMAKSDPYAGALSNLANMGSAGANAVAKINDLVDSLPEAIAKKIMPNVGEDAQKAFAQGIRKFGGMATGAVGAMIGHATGIGAVLGYGGAEVAKRVGGLVGSALDLAQPLARELSLIGDQYASAKITLPFLRAYAEQTSGVPAAIASKLDKLGFSPVLYAAPKVAVGAGVGASLGRTSGISLSAVAIRVPLLKVLGGGFVFGSAGAGLGQIWENSKFAGGTARSSNW